jgi:hypothetical protein
MKKLILVSTILVNVGLMAQDSKDNVKLWTIYPGYVITHDNDTIYGYIKLNNHVSNQQKALFYNSSDDKKFTEKYKPKDIKAYKTGSRFYSSFKFWPETEAKGHHFFYRMIAGPISLYVWYYETTEQSKERLKIDDENILNSKIDLSFSEDELSTQLIGIKHSGEPTQLDKLKFLTNFKKNMSKYVEDYPELAEKIANKEEGYQYANLEEIIKEYNAWYLANQ